MIVTGKISKRHLKALHYYAEQLFTPQKRRHIEIQVKYRKKMDYLGLVTVEDHNVLGVPNSFIIELQRDTEAEMLKTLGHEMVHVLQYARGELNETMTMWRGKRVNADKIPYSEQPWEVEAESIGLNLYESFLASETR
jgi:hypothetical protein